jgi:hypothetical protein
MKKPRREQLKIVLSRGFSRHHSQGLGSIFVKQAGAERNQALQAGENLLHFDLNLPQIVNFGAKHDLAQEQRIVIFNGCRCGYR